MIGSFFKMLCVLLLVGWVSGLLWYVEQIPASPSSDTEPTDAIIVLTGGSKRLGEGFKLLRDKKAKELLITGVGEGVKLAELLAQQNVELIGDALDARVISLDYAAISTATNATSADAWMKTKGFTTARLVTANYHMPRAMLEFSAAMPDVAITPQPVFPDNEFQRDNWFTHPNSIKLLTLEYIKYMVTSLKHSNAKHV